MRAMDGLDLGITRRYGFKRPLIRRTSCRTAPTRWWVTPNHFGIDQGPVALMIENYRNGLIWNIIRPVALHR